MVLIVSRRTTCGITSLCGMLVLMFAAHIAIADEHDFMRGLDIEEEEEGEIDERLIKDFTPSTKDVELQCYTSSMCLSLKKDWLRKNWGVEDKKQLTLLRRCDKSVDENTTHIILCTEKGKLTSCGSKFFQNDTHASFSNNVHILRQDTIDDLVPSVQATIPWTCSYPMKVLVGVTFVPQISPVTVFLGNKTGYGEFEAAMFLYRDEAYRKVYDTSPQLHISDKLRVKVQLLRGPTNSRMQIYKCWGTAVEFPKEEDLSFTLIDEFCPSEEGIQAEVKLRNNGDLQHVLWEANVFRFIVSPQVYIHCHVKVCFAKEKCEKTCSNSNKKRKRREVESPPGGLLSMGPINIGDDVPEITASLEYPEIEETTAASAGDVSEKMIFGLPRIAVFAVVGGLAVVCFISILAVALAVYKKTRTRDEEKSSQYWKEQAEARSRLSARFTLSNTPPFEIPISVPNTIAVPDRRGSNTSQ